MKSDDCLSSNVLPVLAPVVLISEGVLKEFSSTRPPVGSTGTFCLISWWTLSFCCLWSYSVREDVCPGAPRVLQPEPQQKVEGFHLLLYPKPKR